MKEKKENKKQSWNYPKRLFYLFLFSILLLYIQYGYLSLSPNVYGENMDLFARKRDTARTILSAKRGTIFDSEGNILALNVSSYTVIAYLDKSRTTDSKYPKHVVDKEKTAEALAPVLSMEKDTLLRLLSMEGVYQVELGPGGRGISELKKEEVENLGLDGIDFIENPKRYYPNGDFASYIIGYAKSYPIKLDYDSNNELTEDEIKEKLQENPDYKYRNSEKIVGELGIELQYDELLKGTDGKLIYQRDKYGYKIPDTKEDRTDAVDGKDIYLTIDSAIQRFVEGALKEQAAIYTPEWMMLTVMDAKTGDILATASTPSFDPNIRNIVNYENPLTSYLYEPGSTMKTYTYMCAMEKGTYKGSATYQSGSYQIGEDVVQDWNSGVGWGTITFDKGYEYSSNTGAVNIVNQFITKNELRDCLEKYGFGNVTGIELPRELSGSIKFTYPMEVAAASYGQGITTTAIQQLQGLTLISNNGKMLTPHIVSKIVDTNTGETVYERKIKESEQIISKDTVDKMKELMYNVVHNREQGSTSGILYDIEGFEIIGKSGTAQIYDSKNGGYLKGSNDYIFSFGGMYPKENPEIIVYGAVKRPSLGQNTAIAKATQSVMKSIAKYRNMFTEDQDVSNVEKYQMESTLNQFTVDVKNDLSAKGMKVVIIGDGERVISASPSVGTTIISGDRIFLITNGENITLENLKGWSRIDAMNYLNLLGLKITSTGYGYVDTQSIEAGTSITKGMEISITLVDKYNFSSETKE
ncbi:MAG: PASTA domain-containing protein [Bacilli bacterium]|nr:PASTA domain-containing protein [Bacilli bacterium]